MGISLTQNSFTSGELSEELNARTELSPYNKGARLIKNFIVKQDGGIYNRPGTRYISEVKTSSKKVRLIPFQFSVTQSYMIEFGDLYIRFYTKGGQLIDGTPVEVTSPYLEADLPLLKFVQSADVIYIQHPSYAERQLVRNSATSWTLDTIDYGAAVPQVTFYAPTTWIPGNPLLLPFTHHYAITVVDIYGIESDTLYAYMTDTNTGTGFVADTDYFIYNPGGADQTNLSHFNIYKSLAPVDSTQDSGTIQNAQMGLLDQQPVYTPGTKTYWREDTRLEPDMSIRPPKSITNLGDSGGYPGCSVFHDQRRLVGRADNTPSDFSGSIVNDYDNYNVKPSGDITDEGAFTFTLNSRLVNEIRWMVSMQDLIVGTSDSEWRVRGADGGVITANSVNAKSQSEYGVSNILPIIIGSTLAFVDSSESRVRDLTYNFNVDGYDGNDLTILARHLFDGHSITSWCYQKNPESVIWAVRDDGVLLGLTYSREHKVVAWHRHITDGEVEQASCITTGPGVDEVYLVVKRDINGATKRYVERLEERLPYDNGTINVKDAFFVDSGLSLDAPYVISGATKADPVVLTITGHPFADGDLIDLEQIKGMVELNGARYKVANKATNTVELTDLDDNNIDGTGFTTYVSGGKAREAVNAVSGLDHLEGKDVVVLADGSVERKTVASGAIALTAYASRVHVGLQYTQDIESVDFVQMPSESGATIEDKARDISEVMIRFKNSRALKVGPDEDNLDNINFREFEEYDNPIELFTGEKSMPIAAGETNESRVFLRNEDPVPVQILTITPKVDHGEY